MSLIVDQIHPIPLPKRSYEYRSFNDKLAIASGWGRYATGVHAISNPLRFVKLQIIDGSTCAHTFPMAFRSTNICTSGKMARSTCNGDSGGPLVVQRKKSKKKILIGLTSFGSIFGCDRGYPAAYTKVVSYLDWILDITGLDSYWNPKYASLVDSSEDMDEEYMEEVLRNQNRVKAFNMYNDDTISTNTDAVFFVRTGSEELYQRMRFS